MDVEQGKTKGVIDLKFYPDGKVPEQPHLYFIYGAGGTGKTSLLKQFKGKKLLITFDNSYEVVRVVKILTFYQSNQRISKL